MGRLLSPAHCFSASCRVASCRLFFRVPQHARFSPDWDSALGALLPTTSNDPLRQHPGIPRRGTCQDARPWRRRPCWRPNLAAVGHFRSWPGLGRQTFSAAGLERSSWPCKLSAARQRTSGREPVRGAVASTRTRRHSSHSRRGTVSPRPDRLSPRSLAVSLLSRRSRALSSRPNQVNCWPLCLSEALPLGRCWHNARCLSEAPLLDRSC